MTLPRRERGARQRRREVINLDLLLLLPDADEPDRAAPPPAVRRPRRRPTAAQLAVRWALVLGSVWVVSEIARRLL